MPVDPTSPLPLEGIRVLDIAPVIADTSRNLGWTVQGIALWWKHISRNKRPITLNLSHPEGQELLLRLVETSDALVESFRPGTLEKWNIPPERLQERNPKLVILRNAAFGQTGPYAKRPGFGTLAEAISGIAAMTGFPEHGPLLPPIALAD